MTRGPTDISGSEESCRTTIKGKSPSGAGANSVNVQKVLWCLHELDLAYERIDAGMAFGRNREPDYLAMNPNGRVPTLVDGDFVLWESNSIMRYLRSRLSAAIAALSAGAETSRQRRSLAGLDPFDAAAGRSPGVLGAGANAGRTARHGRYPEGCRRRSGAVADRRSHIWRRAASSKATISRSPTSRSAPMRGAGSASRASSSRRLAHLERWFAQFAARRPGFVQFVAPPMS